MTPRAAVEHFHLWVCRLLCAGPDRADFAIKGGCNLRFFFGSVRYSEDLDLDVQRVPVRTLKGRVEALLEGPALRNALRSRGISVHSLSAPKQTETTQRWKISLQVPGAAVPVPTKVEFSRRGDIQGAVVEPLDAAFAREHQQHVVLLPHYTVEAALAQKVRALVGRTQVQARDVFDLSVLFSRVADPARALAPVKGELERAVDRAMALSWDEYAGQVVAYLSSEHAHGLDTREAWDALQLQVVERLQRAEGER